MPFFTFIVDYRGGTYVSQVTAPDVEAAVLAWAAQLEIEAIPGLKPKHKTKLERQLAQDFAVDDRPVRLDGLDNAWFTSILVRNKCMYINIVQTERSAD